MTASHLAQQTLAAPTHWVLRRELRPLWRALRAEHHFVHFLESSYAKCGTPLGCVAKEPLVLHLALVRPLPHGGPHAAAPQGRCSMTKPAFRRNQHI